ncbi:MAG TPA: sugar phosphate nucleotidyltransferase, partial [Ktedonobacteraceae bacterium]
LAGAPLLGHVLKSIEAIPATSSFSSLNGSLSMQRPVVVLGHEGEQVKAVFGNRCFYAYQEEQLGTGHAVLSAQTAVDALTPLPDIVLVCYGDTPLVRSEILADLLVEHVTKKATVTFLTAYAEQPTDFGRIVRDSQGRCARLSR